MLKQMRKKLAIMISLVLFIVSFAPSFTVFEQSNNHWAEETYEDFQVHGLVSENDSNLLSENITFNALEKMLAKALGEKILIKEEILAEKDIEGMFVKRGVLAEIIVKVLHMQKPEDITAIEFLEKEEIFNGYLDGSLRPDIYASLGETITLLDRTFGKKVLSSSSDFNGETFISSNVLINREDFELKNFTIDGDLYIAPGIGESDFTLDEVNIQGNIYVLGGGTESIRLNNSKMKNVIVNKKNNKIRIVLSGDTQMKKMLLTSGATIENNSSALNAIKEMTIKTDQEKSIVQLSGNYNILNIYSPIELITKSKGTIKNMSFNKGSIGAVLLSEETVIEDLLIDDLVTLKGNGKINAMKVNVAGVQSEIQPTKIVTRGHKIKLPKKEKSNKSSSNNNNNNTKDDEKSDEEEIFEAKSIGQPVVDLTFTQTGNQISDHKLGFYSPTDFNEQPDDFQGWLLVYSKHAFDTVWSEIKDLSHETIEGYSETGENQRIYQVTNYGWADGLGNTFRANQKDLVTGKDFGPGLNHFYVATYTSEGILGLAEANEVINILPYPKDMELHGDGEIISNYSIVFDSYDDDRIEKNFFLYSEKGIYEMQALVKDASLATVEAWANENKGVLTGQTSEEIVFNTNQKTISGDAFDSENYYVYGAAISDEGVLDLSWAKEMIINKPIPSPATEMLNDGHGIVLPAGGSTSSSSSDSEEFYEYIRESTGKEKPRIAIFSSSRDNFETVYNHYYFDDPTYGSLEDNFEALGFEPVFMPLAIDNAYFYADNEYFSELIKTCDAVFLQGGDQNKHARALLNDDGSDTKMMEAIRYVYSRGGIVSGTSAGMAVMGEYAYGYGIPSVVLQTNETEEYSIADVPLSGDLFPVVDNNNLTIPGIGLVANEVLNDTHFDARGRFGRLVVAMRDTNKTLGIGADEGTGLAIQENIGEVVGHHGIFIADASGADYADGKTFNVTDLTLHYLTKGDKYNFETGEVIPASNKTLITTSDETLEISEDIFKGDYEFTKRLLDFSMNTEDSVEHAVKTSGEPFFITRFRKTGTTEAYTSDGKYLDDLLVDYNQSTIVNLKVDVVEDDSVDTTPPIITDFSYDPVEKPYTVYFMILDDKSGIDESTITQDTVLLTSDTNSIYSTSLDYDPDYGDIKVSIVEDNYVSGDIVTFDGIKDLAGNEMPTESWLFESGTWQLIDEALDLKAPEIISIDQSADYIVYLQLADDQSGINTETVNQTTVRVESEVNTIFDTSPVYDEEYNDIKISIKEDAYVAGDSIVIEGIEDHAGNIIEPHQWVYDGSDWQKEEINEVIIDEEAPVVHDVYLSSNYDDTAYIYITDDIGIDEATVTTESVVFISDNNTLYKAPKYEKEYDEIKVRINEVAFTTGAAITIDGIKDTSNNPVEKQTWQFNGIEWIKE